MPTLHEDMHRWYGGWEIQANNKSLWAAKGSAHKKGQSED
jgi:hypothetical protein